MTMSALGDKWEVIGELAEALQTSFARSAKREQLELQPTPQSPLTCHLRDFEHP